MGNFVKTEMMDSNICVHQYANTSRDEMIKKVHDYFNKEGYKQEGGTPGNAIYVKGNRTMRILFGAFSKYFKFDISVSDKIDDVIKVGIKKTTTGMSGGLVGMNQVNNEMSRIGRALQQL